MAYFTVSAAEYNVDAILPQTIVDASLASPVPHVPDCCVPVILGDVEGSRFLESLHVG